MRKASEINLPRAIREWTKGRFSLDSGYYAGRPPTKSDLNSPMLEGIYDGIKYQIGTAEAANFVLYVYHLSDLSASCFVAALERFFAADCSAESVEWRLSDRTRITAHGDEARAQAFAVVANAFGVKQKSESEIRQLSEGIKAEFIRHHWNEIPGTKGHPPPSPYGFLR